MANPQVSFRLSRHHLALALKIIYEQEPDMKITSVSQIVKTIFHDYLAKKTYGRNITVTEQDLINLDNISTIHAVPTFEQFQEILLPNAKEHTQILSAIDRADKLNKSTDKSANKSTDKSEISTVKDFSPPEEWTS